MNAASQPMTAARLALLARRARQDNLPALLREPIAIVGIGCRFPGGANTPRRFWELMLERFDGVCEVPADRWSVEDWYDADTATPGRTSVKDGGFLADASVFDAEFFGISPREAERMDPHQRLALEVAWEALEDAGLRAGDVWERQVGVFAASYNNDYVLHQYLRPDAINERTITGVVHSIVANRISYHLGLHGPSLTIDTACSSSLVAVHLACQSLRTAGCDIALAGGVSLMLRPEPFIAMSKAGFMAPDGRCKTFDARADGFGRGEGCGFIVLKRLSDALAAGDRIDAVIRGSAVNQDGRSTVLAAPNGRAQVEVVRAALEDGQVDPATVSYIEAHGTGTRLGDPIEVEALAEALGAPHSGRRRIASVKANIGHLEAAAGIAGLIKAVLCLKQRRIPPQVQFVTENPLLELAQHGFEVPLDEVEWRGANGAFVAGVSSFGVGGTNAHIVLEGAPAASAPPAADTSGSTLLLLSARTEHARDELALRYAEQLDRAADTPEAARGIAAAAATRRTSFDERMAVVGTGSREIAARLRARESGVSAGHVEPGREPRLVFVCNGQGSQWSGMALQLMADEPVFRTALENIDAIFAPVAGWSLLDALAGRDVPYSLDDTACAQPLIFAVQVALAQLFESWGVAPFAVVGHSIGELAAAFITGHVTLEEVVPMVFHRGRVMQQAVPDGAMLAARMTEDEAARVVAMGGVDGVVIAGINAPRSIVFSGHREAVSALGARLASTGVQVKELTVRYGFHSMQMRPLEAELRNALSVPAASNPRAQFISTVTGGVLSAGAFDPAYIARNVVSPVRFDAAIRTAVRAGGNVFVELGPRAVLGTSILETLEAECTTGTVTAALTQRDPGRSGLLNAMGTLYCAGVDADWKRILGPAPVDAPLPLYPWQHQRYWLGGEERSRSAQSVSLAGERIDSPAIEGAIFQRTLDISGDELSDHRIGGQVLVPGAMMLEMARTAGEAVLGTSAVVRDAQFMRPIPLDAPRQSQLWIRPVDSAHSAELYTRLDGSPWVLAFRATVARAEVHSAEYSGAMESRSELDVAAFYEAATARGCDFGPAFRRVRSLHRNDTEAKATLDAELSPDAWLAPSLLDGALQPAIALLDDDAAGLYVPSSVESFQRYHARIPVCSHVRARDGAAAGARTFDVDLLDADGIVVARVQGLLLRPAPGEYAAAGSVLYSTQWQALDLTLTADTSAPAAWLIVGADPDTARELRDAVTASGASAHEFASADAAVGALPQIGNAERPLGWLVCDALSVRVNDPIEYQQALARAVLPVLRSIGHGRGDRIVLLSRGAQTTDAAGDADLRRTWAASFAGVARAVRREHGRAFCTAVDLDTRAGQLPTGLLDVPLQGEPVLAHRAGAWLAPRLESVPIAASGEREQVDVLELATAGDLSSIRTRTVPRRAPAADEVEIEVRWGALNFRDVLAGLGVVAARTTGTIGHECAGTVTAVGTRVHDLTPGDEVLALAEGAFAERVVCRRNRVFRRPAGMTWAESATLPIAYLTAWHALVAIAELRAGQRVLIHSGAGGVGLAAIRIALARGARVFATAGSGQKRAFLEDAGVTLAADSRSTSFAADILAATDGAGVDLVLNSLTGAAVDSGLDLLRSGGWFVELGKRDIRDPSQVSQRYPGVRYATFDLFDEMDRDAATQAAAYGELVHLFERGTLAPLPHVSFPRLRAAAAFQLMARGGHTGKILLSFACDRPAVRSDAAYLVTGGTGVVGLATADWLVGRGARSLVLASRREPQGDAADRIAAWRESGVDVVWHAVDLTDAVSVRALMDSAAGGTLPLRGIVHSAGGLRDGLIADMDEQQFVAPFGAKVSGAFHLASCLEPHTLDFLLLYSAAGSLIDPAGQGNYAGANSVIEAMAASLRARGYPAVSVAWGLWQGGMAAGLNVAQTKRWHAQGLRPISAPQAAVLLDAVLQADRAQVAPLIIDWSRHFHEREDADPAVQGMRATVRSAGAGAGAARAGARLRALPGHRRQPALREFLLECVSRVLGRTDLHDAGPDRPLRDLGLDSLMAVELRNMLTRELGHAFSATLAFDYPDVPALTAHIAPLLFDPPAQRDEAVDLPRAMPRSVTPAVEALIAEMTDEQAELELLAELKQLGVPAGEVEA